MSSKEEIEFLINEYEEKGIKELEEAIAYIKDPKIKQRAKILKLFAKALVTAQLPKERIYKASYILPEIPKEQKSLFAREIIQIPVGKEIIPTPIPSTEKIIQPLQKYEVVKKYEPKVIVKEVKLREPKVEATEIKKPEHITLIFDKETNNALVHAEVSDVYNVTEPSISELGRNILEEMKLKLEKKEKFVQNSKKLSGFIKKHLSKYKIPYKKESETKLRYYLKRDVVHLGKIEPLLHDKNISLISCDAPHQAVLVKYKNKKLKTNINFESRDELNNFILRLAEKTKQRISEDYPILDATLNNFRVHAVFGTDVVNSKFIIKRK